MRSVWIATTIGALVSGCYLAHERGDAVRRDASVPRDAPRDPICDRAPDCVLAGLTPIDACLPSIGSCVELELSAASDRCLDTQRVRVVVGDRSARVDVRATVRALPPGGAIAGLAVALPDECGDCFGATSDDVSVGQVFTAEAFPGARSFDEFELSVLGRGVVYRVELCAVPAR